MNNPVTTPEPQSHTQGLAIFKILVFLGGAFIFFGIAFFISINWSILNDFTKIFSTLGAALAAYLIGILLHHTGKFAAAASSFFMIAGLVFPIGLYVLFDVLEWVPDYQSRYVIITGLCFALFLISQLILPRTIFLFFTILFGTLFYLSLVDKITANSNYVFTNIHEYEFILLGISYILLGKSLDLDQKFRLTGPLYFFGSIFVLGASYCLGGLYYFSASITYWKIMTAIFIFLAFMLSVPLKSKSFLYVGAAFLVVYVSDMSSKFIDIFGHYGWPFILVIIGFALMIIGYAVAMIHKKINRQP